MPTSSPGISALATARSKPLTLAIFASLLCMLFLAQHQPVAWTLSGTRIRPVTFQAHADHDLSLHPKPGSKQALQFWRDLVAVFEDGKPSFDIINRVTEAMPWVLYDPQKTGYQRPDLIDLSSERLAELKGIHRKAVDAARHLGPSLPFVPGTRGIAVASDWHLHAIQTTSIYMLRASGSRLPVEVWLRDHSSYEKEVCEEIFPALGAKCMVMTDFLPTDADPFPSDNRYIFKVLAIMFSSFQQVLTLDCDVLPVNNPDSIFETEPFTSTGLVLWPDLWINSASKHWFDIAGLPEADVHARASTESGQILVDKGIHSSTFILATFYNYWGTKYWFVLWSQGATGQGDKECYLNSAIDLDLPVYQVREGPRFLGYHCASKVTKLGLVQHHPHDDYLISQNAVSSIGDGFRVVENAEPRVLFFHDGVAKPDPQNILDFSEPDSALSDLFRCPEDGQVHRILGPKHLAIPRFGWDVEKAFWSGLRWIACTHPTGFRIWTEASYMRPAERIRTNACERYTDHWNALFPGETWSASVPAFGQRREWPWGGMRE